jgi:catechol 2,3-dioxygenase-like lactoylglutathione lyase family enzyme
MSTAPNEAPRITGAVLDHVAHAVPLWQDVWHRYATDLGAEWSSGGPGPGFAPGQLRFANGAKVEVLMPYDIEVNDFLARFLAGHGPGPHHLTFKVPDLSDAIAQARSFGIEPVGIDFSHPEWLEAFLHPKAATGIVVQIAQEPAPWSSPAPDDYPTARRLRTHGSGPVPPATFVHVAHVVADLDGALALFGGLLGGRVMARHTRGALRTVDLAWPGSLGVRLIASSEPAPGDLVDTWLDGSPGRVHHLAFEVTEPEGVAGAHRAASEFSLIGSPAGSPVWEIDGSANAGLALVLVTATTDTTGATPDGPVA